MNNNWFPFNLDKEQWNYFCLINFHRAVDILGIDQYIGVCHPLHYHHHMTKLRANFSIGKYWESILVWPEINELKYLLGFVWCLSVVMSGVLTLCVQLGPGVEIISDVVIIIVLNIVHTIPVILLSIIYSKIFRAAHTSSERTRRNSAVRWDMTQLSLVLVSSIMHNITCL